VFRLRRSAILLPVAALVLFIALGGTLVILGLPQVLNGEIRHPLKIVLALAVLPFLLVRPTFQVLAYFADRQMLFIRNGELILFNEIYGRIALQDISRVEPIKFFGENLIQISGVRRSLRVAVSEIEPDGEPPLAKIRRLIASSIES